MANRLLALRGAEQTADAARDRFALASFDVRAADRALARQLDDACVGGAAIRDDRHDLGNHVAGAAHDHGVADAHVLALQLVHVVQRRVADGDAADEHGLQPSDGRQGTRAPHLKLDVANDGQLFLGGKLVGNGPARRPRHEAELALPVELVDLVHDAVDVVRQRGTLPADPRVVLEAPGNALDEIGFRASAQAEVAQQLDDRALLSTFRATRRR